jgi:hypothetical protein
VVAAAAAAMAGVSFPRACRSRRRYSNARDRLSAERVSRPDALVATSDVENAPGDKQGFLRFRIGRPICSVIQEGIALKISAEQQQKGFDPSVPFTACFSASMVVTEMIAYIMKWPSVVEPLFQFDFLVGPTTARSCRRNDAPAAFVRGRKILSARGQRDGERRVILWKLVSSTSTQLHDCRESTALDSGSADATLENIRDRGRFDAPTN